MFIAAAILGTALLLASLFFDGLVEGLLPESEWISGPAVGAFFGAFGIVGWMVQSGLGASAPTAVGAGVVGGVVLGSLTFRIARVLMNSPTDSTPRTADLIGVAGRVVTGVRAGGLGEVLVVRGGIPTKLNATAASDLAVGAQVVVVAVASATKVVVEAADEFWSTTKGST